ncbi:DUF378 domain-containing protein [Paenibacillus baekrokdamisoli]|uniref:DUF378 domain-containing protein n=1 Tax=Paenibacillus baekrokdamisoli TaxID=1712516 RepID=A0A3G9IXK2_9BACL|nr:DUF378 domain-containing protein [Paenibacillus baekrokdamisoli]MBB3072376.1 hypothetical protein [Paenibacillus baekrokdamisoli]BBH23246.1 DUF378 domain-containing protein [Paenibacillus baekrokdamisoli]
MKVLNIISLILIILGGLNWLSVGLFKYDVVSEIFGGTEEVGSRIVYIVVGVAALYALALFSKVASED